MSIVTGLGPAALVTGIVGVGLVLSNCAYDLGVPQYVSRKIGHGAGGAAFLVSLLFASPVWPIALAGIFGGLLYAARLFRPSTFRGVGGTGRQGHSMAEVWFAWSAVPVFLIAWYWLGKPEIAVASLLFMAWGDGVTGLVRAGVYHRPTKGIWGSLAMLAVCLGVALAFVRPVWIGLVGAVTATATEYFYGDNGSIKWADDNLAVPLLSMTTMLMLMAAAGTLKMGAL